MFVLPFLLYTYFANNQTFTIPDSSTMLSWMNLNVTHPDYFHWMTPSTKFLPAPTTTYDMTPYAVGYFLMGAVFFLASACMILPSKNENFSAIDGIATMSDFTKSKSHGKPNRELRSLIHENGMPFDEFIHRMTGNLKRARTGPFSS